jgi:antitoxin CptB
MDLVLDIHRMMSDLDVRRRRALYRAQHRGTKEMDHLLGRYAEARLEHMDEAALALFETLLALPDPEIQTAIVYGEPLGGAQISALIGTLRRFHGLAEGGDT